MNPKQSDALERVMDLVRFLRTNCPWDAAQTPRSLIPYLLEESHETADAITDGDDGALRSELGDLLLNVAFQLVLGEEREAFGADDVADTVIEKMRRRHPHLYGLGEKEDWEALKKKERGDEGVLHGVARGLDPLSKAHRIQDRVAAVGFDWADYTGALAKVAEELEEVREALSRHSAGSEAPEAPEAGADAPEAAPGAAEAALRAEDSELRASRGAAADVAGPSPPAPAPAPVSVEGSELEEELGDLLFAVVNLTRLAGAHPLTALQSANAKFTRRFEKLERLAGERGIVLEEAGLEALDRLWDEIKDEERS